MPPLSSDKIRVIEGIPLANPNRCVSCGKDYRARYLDFDMDIPEYGAVYFCETCYTTGARVLGWSPPGEVEALRSMISDWRIKYVGGREEAISELYTTIVASGLFAGYPGFLVPSPDESDEALQQDIEPEPDVGKSTSEPGSTDIHISTGTDTALVGAGEVPRD